MARPRAFRFFSRSSRSLARSWLRLSVPFLPAEGPPIPMPMPRGPPDIIRDMSPSLSEEPAPVIAPGPIMPPRMPIPFLIIPPPEPMPPIIPPIMPMPDIPAGISPLTGFVTGLVGLSISNSRTWIAIGEFSRPTRKSWSRFWSIRAVIATGTTVYCVLSTLRR